MELQQAINLAFGGDPNADPPDLPAGVALAEWTSEDAEQLDREVGLLTQAEVELWLHNELADEDFEAPLFKRLVRQWD